jgi:hypothetical protein
MPALQYRLHGPRMALALAFVIANLEYPLAGTAKVKAAVHSI